MKRVCNKKDKKGTNRKKEKNKWKKEIVKSSEEGENRKGKKNINRVKENKNETNKGKRNCKEERGY